MLAINIDFPFFYNIICLLLGLGYAFFLYNVGKNIASKKLTFFLFFLRTIFISLLAFLLLEPVVKSHINTIEKPIVIIAKDNSTSVKDNIDNQLNSFSDYLTEFEVFLYSFSDKLYEGIDNSNNGLRTNYSKFFSEISNKFENRNVAGVVIASDGSYNSGINPEYLSYDFPVYSIALGDTVIYTDLRIDNVLKNDIAFFGNTFPLEISIASTIADNAVSKLIIRNNGINVYEQSVTFLKDINYNTYTVYLPANKIGLQTYTIQIVPLDDEKNVINNTFKTYIDVIDSRYNVLILKGNSSPDIAAYKSVIDNIQNYKIEVKNIDDNIIIEKYQLAVLFGIEDIPSSILNSNIPVIIFNANQLHYEKLNLPVRFTLKGGFEEVGLYKTESFSKFSFSPELSRLIAEAPPLYSLFGKYNFEGDVEFVLNQMLGDIQTNKPVIMLHYLDYRKMAFVTAQGWWRWKLYDYSVNDNNFAFDELFLKLSQYLVLQEDKSLFRLEYDKQYEENHEIVFRASLYNESYELVNNKEVDLSIIDEDGGEYKFQFSKEDNIFLARLGVLKVGTYNFSASVKGSNLKKTGVFDVKEIQIEQLGLSANHDVLKKIADLSNGKMFCPSNINNIIEDIKRNKRNINIIHSQEKLDSLINIPWLLLILLFLIFLEWSIRKYNGLV